MTEECKFVDCCVCERRPFFLSACHSVSRVSAIFEVETKHLLSHLGIHFFTGISLQIN